MFDDTTQRRCPHCEAAINWAATRCKYCWHHVEPLTQAEAASAAIPYSNQREVLRLTREGNAPAVEQLLNERDRLREELADARTALVAVTDLARGVTG